MPALRIAVPCRCCHRRRAHGLDDHLVRVGGPEATALATTMSRSLMSSASPVGRRHLPNSSHRRTAATMLAEHRDGGVTLFDVVDVSGRPPPPSRFIAPADGGDDDGRASRRRCRAL